MDERPSPRVVVLGAGIAGLTAAYELEKLARRAGQPIEVSLLEASPRAGGKVKTLREDGLVFECGPDSFLTARPHALELIEELGLSNELMATNGERKTIYIYRGGRLRAFPEGMSLITPSRLWPFLFSDLLSWRGKLRVALEPWMPQGKGDHDESIASFVRRRLGGEALDVIAAPMLAGIYAGDAETMSLRSTFPPLREMEKAGGLLKSARLRRAPASKPGVTLFMTLKGGLSTVTEALSARLSPGVLKTGCIVEKLERRDFGWVVDTNQGAFEAAAVISALPASIFADVLGEGNGELISVLREIRFASTATVSLVYDAQGFPRAHDGFGFLVPRGEGKTITAATFTSTKFPGRATSGQVLIRCFLGGEGRDEALKADDAELGKAVAAELNGILGLGGAVCRSFKVSRWPQANPQYSVGHGLRLKRIDSCLKSRRGLFAAGCSYRGIGLSDCILSGRQAAAQAVEAVMFGRRSRAGAVS